MKLDRGSDLPRVAIAPFPFDALGSPGLLQIGRFLFRSTRPDFNLCFSKFV